MKTYLALLTCIAITGCAAAPKPAPEKVSRHVEGDRIYVPTVASYIDGDFLAVAQTGHPEETMTECMEKLQRVIGGVLQNDSVPEGGAVLGACEALPAHFSQPK